MNNATLLQNHETKLQNVLAVNGCTAVELLKCFSSLGTRAEKRMEKFVKEIKTHGESNISNL